MGRVRRKKPTETVDEDPPINIVESEADTDVEDDVGDGEELADVALAEAADLDDDGSMDEEVVDLDEVLKSSTGENLALRREIERRLEERRLAKDLDELDFDLD